MTFRSGADARLFLHSLALHSYTRDASSSSSTGMLPTSTLGTKAKTFIPDLLPTWSCQFGGPLDVDATAGGQFATLAAMKAALTAGTATAYPFTFLPLGTDGALWLGDSIKTSLDVVTGLGETVNWASGAQGTGVLDQNGKILENNTAVTTDTNGTSLDNGAATSNGAAFHLHVTAFSGLTDDVITIEDSADDSNWATIVTFTTVAGLTSERKTLTGAVRRYVRVVDNVTGTGSISRFVAISRR